MATIVDMSTPVTRGELREELATFKREFKTELKTELKAELKTELTQELKTELARELKTELARELKREFQDEFARFVTKDELKQELARFATKTELELWGGALLANIAQQFAAADQRMVAMEQRMFDEIARHTRAALEATSLQIAASHELYADLPRRVGRLESRVFGAGPRRTRR
jgi:hypothetical protein